MGRTEKGENIGLVVGNYCHDVLIRDGRVMAETLGGAVSFISIVHSGLSIQCNYVSKVGPDFAYFDSVDHSPLVSSAAHTTSFHAQFVTSSFNNHIPDDDYVVNVVDDDNDDDGGGDSSGHSDRVLKRVNACEPIRAADLPDGKKRFDFGLAVGVGGEILPETLDKMLEICDVVLADIQALIRIFDPIDGTVRLMSLKESGFYHLLPRLGFLKASTEEALMMDVDQVRKLCSVVVTNGKEGCSVYNNDLEMKIEPFPAVQIDPTGAGDSFLGGFAAGLVLGLSVPDSALLGNLFGSLAVQYIGLPKLDSRLLQKISDEVHKRKLECRRNSKPNAFKFETQAGHDMFHSSLYAAKQIANAPCKSMNDLQNIGTMSPYHEVQPQPTLLHNHVYHEQVSAAVDHSTD